MDKKVRSHFHSRIHSCIVHEPQDGPFRGTTFEKRKKKYMTFPKQHAKTFVQRKRSHQFGGLIMKGEIQTDSDFL